jgi:hypothetical protein
MLADDGETVTTTRWLACRCERVSTNTRRSRVEAGAAAVNLGATALDDQQQRRARLLLAAETGTLRRAERPAARCPHGRGGAVAEWRRGLRTISHATPAPIFVRLSLLATLAVVDRAGLAELSVDTIAAAWNTTSCVAAVQQARPRCLEPGARCDRLSRRAQLSPSPGDSDRRGGSHQPSL